MMSVTLKKITVTLVSGLLAAAVLVGVQAVFSQMAVASGEIAQVKKLKVTDTTADTVSLSWKAVENADEYKVQLLDENGTKLLTKSASSTKKTLKDLDAETTYKVKVRAVVDGVKGPFSAIVKFTTDAAADDVTQSDVVIEDFAFSPETVKIKAGSSVQWTNQDSSTHTVTSDKDAFDSGNLSNGKTFALDFQDAGTYEYHCDIHPSMTGTVEVE